LPRGMVSQVLHQQHVDRADGARSAPPQTAPSENVGAKTLQDEYQEPSGSSWLAGRSLTSQSDGRSISSQCSRVHDRGLGGIAARAGLTPMRSISVNRNVGQPLLLMNLQKFMPMCSSTRTYECIVEPGAAACCETPRAALRLVAQTPELPRDNANARPARSTLSAELRQRRAMWGKGHVQTAHAALVDDVSTPSPSVCNGRRAAHVVSRKTYHQRIGKMSVLEAVATAHTMSAPPTPLPIASRSLIGRESPMDAKVHTFVTPDSGLSPDSSITEAASSSQSSDAPVKYYGQRRRTRMAHDGLAGEVKDFFTFGRNGLHQVEARTVGAQKAKLRELASHMASSMRNCFSREVWDEVSEIPYPEVESEEVEQGPASEVTKPEAVCRRHISCDKEIQQNVARVEEERLLSALAKQTGCSVLDVADAMEKFHLHATADGQINIRSDAFDKLVMSIWEEVKPEELTQIANAFSSRRCRTNTAGRTPVATPWCSSASRCRRGTRFKPKRVRDFEYSSVLEDDASKNTNLRFPEFFVEFIRLVRPAIAAGKCSATRFTKPERIFSVMGYVIEDVCHANVTFGIDGVDVFGDDCSLSSSSEGGPSHLEEGGDALKELGEDDTL